jgi:hypothetical protein
MNVRRTLTYEIISADEVTANYLTTTA